MVRTYLNFSIFHYCYKLQNTSTANRAHCIQKKQRQLRPKSAGRNRDELNANKEMSPIKSGRPEREKLLPAPKRQSNPIPKRPEALLGNKTPRPVIKVPVTQKQPGRYSYLYKNDLELPDQETIKKREELEVQQSNISDTTQPFSDLNEKDSITSRSDKLMQLKISWQENNVQFEKLRNELKDRQRLIMELYATLRSTHQKMCALGQKVNLPAADELNIMNVAKLTPEQLLELCATSKQRDDSQTFEKSLNIDTNKIYNIPSKLVATCEQTLIKRKEIIDWFETLKTLEKGISMHKLSKKINEFNAENEMLTCSLDKVKVEFYTELNKIADFIRKGINETIALQLRTEELTYELSELSSQNIDLRKQLYNADHLKSQSNRGRLEQLEKELKEEKCKKTVIKDRLTRAEGQIKIGTERASQLEAALEQARTQTWTLERTVQQLQDQNQKLQVDFDKELNKLTQSIRENTVHLEEIADARGKLQTEKEDLEKRLNELSEHYNESLKNMKHEINVNVVKFIETDKKCQVEIEEKKRLQEMNESLRAQLLESELRSKELYGELRDKKTKLDEYMKNHKELEETKRELNDVNVQVEKYRNQLILQSEAIKDIEYNFKESVNMQENFKRDLSNKEEYISELEKKQSLLEEQLQESESKMSSYEEQLTSLKKHISQLKSDFGELENRNEINDLVNQQRNELLEANRQNEELTKALQNKDVELENLMEQEQLITEQRDDIIKVLSKKDEEQTNIIKLLRNNLEMRVQADTDLNQQIFEKNSQIESLINNLDSNKNEISDLENIILTLKDQSRKLNVQSIKYQDKITELENKLQQYELLNMETKNGIETPNNNLDNLIKILENELGMPLESQPNIEEQEYPSGGKYGGEHRRDKPKDFDYREGNTIYHSGPDSVPTKIVMGNFVKKTYIPTKDEIFKSDNLDHKKAITNMNTQGWVLGPDPGINKVNFQQLRGVISPTGQRIANYSPNLRYLIPNQPRDDKKCKMFKLAGHKL
ncbi:interaptin-like [Achroia grisella]|uniref:interaptin-like n=1 Tax=Achroia grisella TaxID=688607 RepID=UPI0027D21F49|nr:interaptin-like [Achroia grisella]